MIAAILAALVITANQGDGSLSAVDTVSGAIRNVRLSIMPHNVQACGDNHILVTGMSHTEGMSGESMPGELVVVDRRTLRPTASIDVGVHPAHVVCDSSARYAYVTLSGENSVAVVDLRTMQKIAAIRTDAFPHGLRLSNDGRKLYVANVRGASVSAIDIARRADIGRIKVGGAAIQVAPEPRSETVYVTIADRNQIAALDVRAQRVVKRLQSGRNPQQVTMSPDGSTIVVANQGTAERPDDRVLIASTSSLQPVAWIEVGKGPHGVAIDTTGRFAYVTSTFSGTLSVIDLVRYRVIRIFKVGKEPNGVTAF